MKRKAVYVALSLFGFLLIASFNNCAKVNVGFSENKQKLIGGTTGGGSGGGPSGSDSGSDSGSGTGSDTGFATGTSTGGFDSDSGGADTGVIAGEDTGSTTGSTTGESTGTDSGGIVQLSHGVNAIAFEDLYYLPGETPSSSLDYDYNDFVVNFKIFVIKNSANKMTDIYFDFYPRATGGGDDHKLLLVLNGQPSHSGDNNHLRPTTPALINGSAVVNRIEYGADGSAGASTFPSATQDVVIFSSTHGAFGATGQINSRNTSPYIPAIQNVRIHIALNQPELNEARSDDLIDPSKFRLVLYNKATKMNIDIINVVPSFRDHLGYPFGFIIPTDWKWPKENARIDDVYPTFSQYRNYLNGVPVAGDPRNWFTLDPVGDFYTRAPASWAPVIPPPAP